MIHSETGRVAPEHADTKLTGLRAKSKKTLNTWRGLDCTGAPVLVSFCIYECGRLGCFSDHGIVASAAPEANTYFVFGLLANER